MTPEEIAEARKLIEAYRVNTPREAAMNYYASLCVCVLERALNALEDQMKQPTEPPQPEFDREACEQAIQSANLLLNEDDEDWDARDPLETYDAASSLRSAIKSALAHIDRLESQLAAKDAEIAELRLGADLGREELRAAWSEFNSIRARSGAPPGVSEDWWNEMTDRLEEMLGNDNVPWMLKAARMHRDELAKKDAEIERLEEEVKWQTTKARNLLHSGHCEMVPRLEKEIAKLRAENESLRKQLDDIAAREGT